MDTGPDRAMSWLAVFCGLVFCSRGEQASDRGLGIPAEDAITFTRWARLTCFEECREYARRGCCQPDACGPDGPNDGSHYDEEKCECWSMLCRFDICCHHFAPSETIAKRAQQLMRLQSLVEVAGPPRLCPPSRGDEAFPELPPYEGPKQTQAPFAAGDIAVVVVTSSGGLQSGRARAAARTWVSRFPPYSVFFAKEASAKGEVQTVAEELGNVTVMPIQCPSYWYILGSPISCDSYNSHIYVGPLGLREALQRQPHRRWFLLVDDDTFIDPWSLAQQLEDLPINSPMCLGNKHWQDCDDGLSVLDPVLRPGCRANFSWLGQGYGILCNNAAVRRLYRHLELGVVAKPIHRWGAVYSDVVLGRCMESLRIPTGHLQYYGATTPHDFMRESAWGRVHWPVSIHKVRDASEFALLDAFTAPLQEAAARRQRMPPDFSSKAYEGR
eukprot:TRINITY_DN23875_c0_g2_i1.p1 TRINITY_DN23875_c0_g2~~TRINITY_DN23875_c0_g2_i1.p1  ORF type:complete len:442 (-),score=28.21 TRINITY_DN23875_c0_g2_i1:766-2091(-)